jgi:hypothetical protein
MKELMRSIGPWMHGIIDYCSVIILAIAPSVTGFTGKQAMICYALAAVHFLLTILTRFPLGWMKHIGFPIHGAIEFLVSILLMAMPWLANFSNGVLSTRFFVYFGVLLFVIWFLTDYRNVRGKVVSG